MSTSEHQLLAALFEDTPERVAALVMQLERILDLESAATGLPCAGADLWEAKTTLYPTELILQRVVRLADHTGAYARAIVVQVQHAIAQDQRRCWPIYGWGAWRETGLDSAVVVIAATDAVALWAQQPIMNGAHTFYVHVIGRHNVPAITDEKLARTQPLLTVLSAALHLQSTAPLSGSSMTQAQMDRQCAQQMKLADMMLHEMGWPQAARYVRSLFTHLSDEAKRMAIEDSGPILRAFVTNEPEAPKQPADECLEPLSHHSRR